MRRFAALVTTVLVAAGVALPVALSPTWAAPAAAAGSALPLSVAVTNMNPWTPTPSQSERPLTITVSLHNTSGSNLSNVVLSAGRGTPVSLTSELDTTLSDSSLPTGLLSIPARPSATEGIDVPAGQRVSATFRTTTTTSYPAKGLCLCANAAYPVYIVASNGTASSPLGFTRTFVTSVDKNRDSQHNSFHKLDVAWVWPLIDAPHRLTDSRVFTDSTLPSELSSTGRLTRALQVVQDMGQDHQITLVLDPDLIDEVAILAGGNYGYRSSSGTVVKGTKLGAASTWLANLRQVLTYGDVHPEFTPYADPDVQSLASGRLTWHDQMPPTMLARVEQALDLSSIPSTLSWPAGSAATQRTLTQIAADGASTVLLGSSGVRPSNVDGLPVSAATLRTSSGRLTAALTTSAVQSRVAAAMRDDKADPLAQLPTLLAQLAMRTTTEPYETRSTFLVAPRYVDPNVAAADTVIDQTTSSSFTSPASLQVALEAGLATGSSKSQVRDLSSSTPTLSPAILDVARQVARSFPAVKSLLTGGQQSSSTASTLLADLGRGLQRVESSAYLSSSTASTPSAGAQSAEQLRRQVDGLLRGVYIVQPEAGRRSYSYTLASKNSPLPITVDNTLPYRVFVHIRVETVGGLPGLTTTDLGVRTVAADSKQTFRVPTHVQRSGSIALTATLMTPGEGLQLGPRVRLTVHSTVVGTIGIVITVVAAVVLVLALVVRYVRRLQRLRRKRRASSGDVKVPARIGT